MKKILAISCMTAMTWTACTKETDLDGQEQSVPLSGHLLTGWNTTIIPITKK